MNTKKKKLPITKEDEKVSYKNNKKTISLVQLIRIYDNLYESAETNDIPIRKFSKTVVKSAWERLIKLGLVFHRTKMKSHSDMLRVFKIANASRYQTYSNPAMERYACIVNLDEVRKIITPKHKLFDLTTI